MRVDAAHLLLPIVTNNPFVIYSDEASFRTDGHVNKWNAFLWDYERPEDFIVESDQGAKRVMVWAAMSSDKLFGPYFFPSMVTADVYQAVISEFFIPDVQQQIGNLNHLWFQQDGAPAHAAGETKSLLQSYFHERIISRGFSAEWPPRSPDLTPCDFHLWSAVAELVYVNGAFTTVDDLRSALINAFNTLRIHHMDDIKKAVLSVPRRLHECIQVNGSHLVHR